MSLQTLFMKLETIKNTLPEIYKLWKNYLDLKQKQLEDLEIQLDNVIQNSQDVYNIGSKQTITLLLLSQLVSTEMI